MASKSSSARRERREQSLVGTGEGKSKNGKATMCISANKKTQSRSKAPGQKKTRKESDQPTTKAPAKRARKETKSAADAIEESEEQLSSRPPTKRARKALNKKERLALCSFLNEVDVSILMSVVRDKLDEQSLSETLNKFVDEVFKNEVLLKGILLHHRERFVELYSECQKGVDSFLRFQLQWHRHCSAFLLGKECLLSEINLDKSAESSVAMLREQWLDFCDI